MSIIERMLKQKCVYWPPGSDDEDSGALGLDFDDYGQPLYADPVELKCRWEDRAEEFITAGGTNAISRSVVYVASDVRTGGVLLLTTLVALTATGNLTVPKNNDGAWEIKRFDKLPNLKATKFVRTAYL